MEKLKPDESLNDSHQIIHKIKHFLPSQAVLKDFVHHNTLHAVQELNFHEGITKSESVFGYSVYLQLNEFRELYKKKKISEKMLVSEIKNQNLNPSFLDTMLYKNFDTNKLKRIGALRSHWKSTYSVDLDLQIHPILFRYLCNFLDQGISAVSFPYPELNFFEAMKKIDSDSFFTIFLNKKGKARKLFHAEGLTIDSLIDHLIEDSSLKETYLFDQQFSHPGWSGLVSMIEDNPDMLIEKRKISLEDIIKFELLLEIDFLDFFVGEGKWKPINNTIDKKFYVNLFEDLESKEINLVLKIFQNAYERMYYEEVLQSIQYNLNRDLKNPKSIDFQAIFCIDDRESSLRMYLEDLDPNFETYGTPGFFGFEFYFQPSNSNNMTKQCPAPVNPNYIIQEIESKKAFLTDYYLKQDHHSFFKGWFLTQSLGYWSALKLFFNIFKPSTMPATTTSLKHMDKVAKLTIEYKESHPMHGGLQIGYSVDEMAQRVYNLLLSIGLTEKFSKIIYIVGHGASSVNNPHYSAYDCGACSGRPGSVNARVFAYAANLPSVRNKLRSMGIDIPDSTYFVGSIHDTTRDDIDFFDENSLNAGLTLHHEKAKTIFEQALSLNAKERARRFLMLNPKSKPNELREKVRLRSISLFEPRPELNHATNSLCLVGPRSMSKELFLDRRAFLNSYDPYLDPKGQILEKILNAAAPVCGGINLEYYFSRVDNQKLGAGTKLPHNVMGLIGVANGVDGDLRPGLPVQMIEVHDPIRLMIIVYQDPSLVLETIQRNPATYEWFKNEWVHLACISPKDNKLYLFKNKQMTDFIPQETYVPPEISLKEIEAKRGNIIPSLYHS